MPAIEHPSTTTAMIDHLRQRLGGVIPDVEIRIKAELAVEINRLKRERHAVILGHNYMEPALYHSVPDFTGDSLYLSRVAAKSDAAIIIFCGVRFMAETAKILNPQRLVLLPSPKGGCSLAAAITAEEVRALRALYPGVPVVSYVNTYADVKAETDICCTSSNAEAVVRHLRAQGHERIIFLPDEYLGSNVANQTQMAIVFCTGGPQRIRSAAGEDRQGPPRSTGADGLQRAVEPPGLGPSLIGWRGRCEVHEKFTVEDIRAVRQQFADAVVLSHPECSPEVVRASDFSGSTTEMIRYVERMERGRYLLLTECSMGDNIASRNPQREMIRLCSVRCPHMNEISLEETLRALRQDQYAVEVPEAISARARASLDRMIGIG
jgi:quinolinate synthase